MQNMGLAHARESYAIYSETPASYSLIFQAVQTAKKKYKRHAKTLALNP